MKLARWNRFGNLGNLLQQFQSEMSSLFDRFSDGNNRFEMGAYPALNVWEDADHVYLEAELAGVEFKDLVIDITGGNQLTVKGERKPPVPEQGLWHRQERTFSAFSRSLILPFAVDVDKIDARLANGVLQLKLAKHESAKPRKITVKAE